MAALWLGLLALALAGPVPWATAQLTALRRTPAAALAWWQCLALAAVLSALAAGVALLTTAWPPGDLPLAWVEAVVAGFVTAVVLVRLVWAGHSVGTELREMRRSHLEQVALVARRTDDGVMVLDHPVPVAYCVPALGRSRVVLSEGAVQRLTPEQLEAVVAHERAHLRSRHDLLLEVFAVLHRAFPRFVASRTARWEVSLLVEVLADRAAARRCGARALATALVEVAAPAPAGSTGSSGSGDMPGLPVERLTARARLLADRTPHRVQAVLLVAGSAVLLALPTAPAVLSWLTRP